MTAHSDNVEATVLSVLQKLGLPYELIHIDPDFADTAEFCQKYGFSMDCSGNTIIVASKRGEKKFSACVVKASRRLDVNKTVRNLMGVSRASFASAQETMEVTGMAIGGVTPFALPGDIAVYVDEELIGEQYVILGSGSRSSKLKVPPEVLPKIPNSQIISGLSMPPRPADQST